MEGHATGVRVLTVLPQVNPLPSPQGEPAITDGDGQVYPGQRGANVRRHVVFALSGVNEKRVAIGGEATEKALQIAADVWIGVLLYQERSGSVAQMQGQQALLKLIPGYPGFDFVGKFVKTATSGRDAKFMNGLPQQEVLRSVKR